jgi:hypothetical protein
MKFETKAEWLTFEVNEWRDAVQNRGLKLDSLEAEWRKLVAEAISVIATAASLKSLSEPFSNSPTAGERPRAHRKDLSSE